MRLLFTLGFLTFVAACSRRTTTETTPARPAPSKAVAATPKKSTPIVAAARSQIGKTTIYDPAYVGLKYPGGDVASIGPFAIYAQENRGKEPEFFTLKMVIRDGKVGVYIDGLLPPALAQGGEREGEGSAWWSFARLQTAASVDFARHTPRLRAGWAPLENRIEAERKGVEAAAQAAAQSGDPDEAARQLSEFMEAIVAEALELANTLRGRPARYSRM